MEHVARNVGRFRRDGRGGIVRQLLNRPQDRSTPLPRIWGAVRQAFGLTNRICEGDLGGSAGGIPIGPRAALSPAQGGRAGKLPRLKPRLNGHFTLGSLRTDLEIDYLDPRLAGAPLQLRCHGCVLPDAGVRKEWSGRDEHSFTCNRSDAP